MKKIFSLLKFTLLLFTLIVFLFLLFIPESSHYSEGLLKYDEIKHQIPDSQKQYSDFFRSGIAFGYTVAKDSTLSITLLLVSFLITSLIFYLFQEEKNNKVFSEISVREISKSVFTNIILFTFTIFLKRSSQQLNYYFDLSKKSKVVAITTYALVYIAMMVIFSFNHVEFMTIEYKIISSLPYLFSVILITITLFSKLFRKNYEKKLFWISFSILMIQIIISSFLSNSVEIEDSARAAQFVEVMSVYSIKNIFAGIIVVTAFSFYAELMKVSISQKRNLESEILLAENLQKELIPEIDLQNDNFQIYGKSIAAQNVGGDYIDFVPLKNNKYVISVADVSGHNIASGLLMSMLKTAFRTELKYADSCPQLASSLNQTIFENKNKSMFISFIMGLINTENKKIELINAGHPPILHYSFSDNEIREIRTGDLALGLKKEHDFKSHKLNYDQNDILVLFSDGLMETTDKAGNQLGIEGIKNIILKNSEGKPLQIYDAIFNKINSINKNITVDDNTLQVIKFI